MYLEWQHSTPQPSNTSPSMTQLDNFQAFLDKKAAEDDNWKFWGDFVMKNCLPYISLYISVQSSDWILSVASTKSMVPTFAAYDRPHYHHLIPQHIADILQMPTAILAKLQAGCFTASITGRAFRDVALDEAHEMLINKDLKRAIVRPSCEYLRHMSSFYQHRAAYLHNLTRQVLPPREQGNTRT